MFQIRPAAPHDAASIAQIHVESWRTTYAGLVPDEYLAQLSVDARAQRWQQAIATLGPNQVILVAADEAGQVVGFASGGPNREADDVYAGEIYAIYLLQAHQGRGLGRQLMRAVIAHLLEHDIHSVLVWVLADNPACGFYAALGGQPVAEKPIEIGGVTLRELAYGWRGSGEVDNV
jgi:L-amino acid N-acyltransferase YncA